MVMMIESVDIGSLFDYVRILEKFKFLIVYWHVDCFEIYDGSIVHHYVMLVEKLRMSFSFLGVLSFPSLC